MSSSSNKDEIIDKLNKGFENLTNFISSSLSNDVLKEIRIDKIQIEKEINSLINTILELQKEKLSANEHMFALIEQNNSLKKNNDEKDHQIKSLLLLIEKTKK